MNKLLLFLALAGSSLIATAQSTLSLPSAVAPADLARPAEMENYELVTLNPARLHELTGLPNGNALRFSLQSQSRQKTFALHRFEQRTNDYVTNFRDAADRKPSAQWVGPNANFTIDENFVLGRWEEDGESLHLEPLWLQVPDAPQDLYVIYRESDMIVTEDRSCLLIGKENYVPPSHDAEETDSKAAGECYVVEIALAADLPLYQSFGNNANSVENFMLGVLADVQTDYDDAFADELRYAVTATYIATSEATDPWSDTTDPASQDPPGSFNFVGLLPEFSDWGNGGGFGGASYDVATLWTARDFDGETVGVAWRPGVCTNGRYNTCQRLNSATSLRVLWSHELGHNWSSEHDGPNGFIMSPSVNATSTWSAQSIASVENYYNDNLECLSSCAPPVAAATSPFPRVYTGSKVPFEDLTEGTVSSRTWSFPGGTPATSDLRFPVVTYANPGNYVATLTISGPSGNASTTVNVDVATETGRTKLLSYEIFEDNLGEITIDNPDNGVTWQRANSDGNGSGVAAVLDNFNEEFPGQADRLQLPVQDLTDLPLPVLEFEYAYRRYSASLNDELRVRVSTDGINFTQLFQGRENGTQNFATGPDLTNLFIPAAGEDWCFSGPGCVSLDLSAYANEPTVFIEIENLSGYGNAMWIDNIVLSGEVEAILPVEWLSFAAVANDKSALLNWSVNQDEANAGFYVERTDHAGGDWQPLAWVPAAAGTTTADYAYEDRTVRSGNRYLYRLRQTDSDGRESFSELREVSLAGPGSSRLTPNPAGTETQLRASFQSGTYALYSAAGRRLRSGVVAEGTATFNVEELPAGLYFVRLSGDDDRAEVLRLMKR